MAPFTPRFFPLTPAEAAGLAGSLLGHGTLTARAIEAGWGNDNWRIEDPTGRSWLLKLSPAMHRTQTRAFLCYERKLLR